MTRSVGRLGRFGGALLVSAMTLLLLPAFSGEALADTFTAGQFVDAPDANPGNGTCAVASGGCTFRAAVQEANAQDGRDTIVLVEGTYLLNIPNRDLNGDGTPDDEGKAATGDLDIRDETFVRGAGLGETTVTSTTGDRHLHLLKGAPSATVLGLALINSNGVGGTSSGRGGGVLNAGNLALRDVALRQNQSLFGGAVDNRGVLTMAGTTVSGNTALLGGGVYNEGSLRVFDSTISTNTAIEGPTDLGGSGGGLYSTTATAAFTNSTIASNTAEVRGGGINNAFGDVQLLNVTVNENASPEGTSIANTGARTYLQNTIVAKGAAALGGDNCAGGRTVSRGNNLSDDGSCGLNARGDQEGKDPLLAPISDDDDPTAQIFEPQSGSPAIDKAANGKICPRQDQREAKRPRDGDADGVATCDIGSVEARPQSPAQGPGV